MAVSKMCEALSARGPALSLGYRATDFEKLIGSWNVEVFDIEDDGAQRVSEGEWHLDWVLEGHALQDVLIVPRRPDRRHDMPMKGNRFVTTLRLFDKVLGAWRAFSIDPLQSACLAMIGRTNGTEIAEEGLDSNGTPCRRILSVSTDLTFRARGNLSGQRRDLADRDADFCAKGRVNAGDVSVFIGPCLDQVMGDGD